MRPRSPPHWTASIIHLASTYSYVTLDEAMEGTRQGQLQNKLRQARVCCCFFGCIFWALFFVVLMCLSAKKKKFHSSSVNFLMTDLILGILSFQLMFGLV